MFAAAIVAGTQNARRAREFGSIGPMPLSRRTYYNSAKGDPNYLSSAMTTVLGCISLGMLVFGIYFFVDSTAGRREKTVLQYNAAVASWVSSERQAFADLVVSALITTDESPRRADSNMSLKLVANSSSDALDDAGDVADLSPYSPLVYRMIDNSRIALPLPGPDAEERWVNKLAADLLPLLSIAVHLQLPSGDTIAIETPQTAAQTIHRTHAPTPQPKRKCEFELHGTFEGGMCLIRRQLTGICVQVARVDGVWQLAPRVEERNTSFGCYYHQGDWQWAKYEVVTPKSTGPQTRPRREPGPFMIEVRSAADPFLAAAEITHGKLDFGRSATDDRATAICLLVFGLLLAIPPLCRVVVAFRPSADRHSYYSHEDDEACGVMSVNERSTFGGSGQQFGQSRTDGMQLREWSSRSNVHSW
mmetsp:Transcript_5323/g.11804  ORF Transcript_5323/g.11804 Transcript_5323/m.11804 type:complete len:418 (+) Transcript_5323:81-1334(+)